MLIQLGESLPYRSEGLVFLPTTLIRSIGLSMNPKMVAERKPALFMNPMMVGEKKKTALILAFAHRSCFSPHDPHPAFGHLLPLPWAKDPRRRNRCFRVSQYERLTFASGSGDQCTNCSGNSSPHPSGEGPWGKGPKISAVGLMGAALNRHADTAADSSPREKVRMRGKSTRSCPAAPCFLTPC